VAKKLYVCTAKCFFRGILWKQGRYVEFDDSVQVPRHFQEVGPGSVPVYAKDEIVQVNSRKPLSPPFIPSAPAFPESVVDAPVEEVATVGGQAKAAKPKRRGRRPKQAAG
jgi:hypothetical protein